MKIEDLRKRRAKMIYVAEDCFGEAVLLLPTERDEIVEEWERLMAELATEKESCVIAGHHENRYRKALEADDE